MTCSICRGFGGGTWHVGGKAIWTDCWKCKGSGRLKNLDEVENSEVGCKNTWEIRETTEKESKP